MCASGFSNLTYLSFRRCVSITAEAMEALSSLDKLVKLDFERCPQIHGGFVHLQGWLLSNCLLHGSIELAMIKHPEGQTGFTCMLTHSCESNSFCKDPLYVCSKKSKNIYKHLTIEVVMGTIGGSRI